MTDHRNFCLCRCNSQQRENPIHGNDYGDSTSFRNVAQPKAYSTIHQQRYAATAHPKEVEAARESAAMSNFECDAEACSLWAMENRNKNSEPDQWLVAYTDRTSGSKAILVQISEFGRQFRISQTSHSGAATFKAVRFRRDGSASDRVWQLPIRSSSYRLCDGGIRRFPQQDHSGKETYCPAQGPLSP